jgi:predicted amidohydrolase
VVLEEIAVPRPRPVRIGSVSLRPRQTGGKEGSLNAFLKALDEVAMGKPDIVCLGEGITLIGHNADYSSLAEPVPGPSTERLGAKAREHHMYVVAGVYEREGNVLYNTAVLIDRQGKVAGKYRKVYLPREEIEGGLTPGNSYPVFETDFGRIGMMICWDSQYADPARALAAKGAEIIFLPIWGGYSTLMQARALENHVYLVTAGYDCETAVYNPLGEALHSTRESGVFKTVAVDLNHRFIEPWLGDMRGRFHKELRLDVPVIEETSLRR